MAKETLWEILEGIGMYPMNKGVEIELSYATTFHMG